MMFLTQKSKKSNRIGTKAMFTYSRHCLLYYCFTIGCANHNVIKKHYTVTENFIVDPGEVWVLDDFGDDRITIITCTDDGTQRQVVVGKLK